MDVLIGGIDDGRILHWQPNLLLGAVAALWMFVIHHAWRTRRWAISRPDWRGALVQSILTGLYCLLTVWFCFGATQLIWDWRLHPMDTPELVRAFRFGRRWLPWLFVFVTGSVLVVLAVDALNRRVAVHRLFYMAVAIFIGFRFWWLIPYGKQTTKEWSDSIQRLQQPERRPPVVHRPERRDNRALSTAAVARMGRPLRRSRRARSWWAPPANRADLGPGR